jgi:hypothetical protein
MEIVDPRHKPSSNVAAPPPRNSWRTESELPVVTLSTTEQRPPARSMPLRLARDPALAKLRIDKTLPRDIMSAAEKPASHREKPSTDILLPQNPLPRTLHPLPRCALARTVVMDAAQVLPATLNLEPANVTARSEQLLPQLRKSRTDKLLPT